MDTTTRYDDEFVSSDMPAAERATATNAPTGSATIAAAFADRERAHDAVHRLQDEGFHDHWIGITRVDDTVDYRAQEGSNSETRVESDNWFMRFFGEGDESLHAALVRHGVSEADARAVGDLPANSAILTVDGFNDPELAAQIITQNGGQLISGGYGRSTFGLPDVTSGARVGQAPVARTTSLYDEGMTDDAASRGRVGALDAATMAGGVQPADATAYDDYGRLRTGTPVDESTRLQLREERLRIDKSRISRGEATIGTEVVSETQNIDVPLIREELFIERRPVRGSTVADGSPIGSGEVIRIPLSQEQLTITKVPVVTEEVVIGKRDVETIQHVSETTRKEQLKTDELGSPVTPSGPLGASGTDPRQ